MCCAARPGAICGCFYLPDAGMRRLIRMGFEIHLGEAALACCDWYICIAFGGIHSCGLPMVIINVIFVIIPHLVIATPLSTAGVGTVIIWDLL